MIIPPKLKILAGFKADDNTVTMEQIIAALEKKQPPATTKTTSSAQTIANGRAKHAVINANARRRQARILQLINERQSRSPDDSYEGHFNAIADSEEGRQLFAQMHLANSDSESRNEPGATSKDANSPVNGYTSKEQAKAAFMAEAEKLYSKLSYSDAWATASRVEPGKGAYEAWKTFSDREKPRIIYRSKSLFVSPERPQVR
jgi:hypothetical protein